jgi:secernin
VCDTLVALANSTADGSVIFAKNSDREPNEAHHIVLIPAASYPESTKLDCTYSQIPQVRHTNAVLLAKPFWIWGAEMGVNEYGVAIGNEAIYTRMPYDNRLGLIGMDFVRLGLERAATALEALEEITRLFETHGQGGNCGFTHTSYYDNSFIIADAKDAWVLETACGQWAAVQVKDVYTISNKLTIESEWDLASEDLVEYAHKKGWCQKGKDFNFARYYSDRIYTHFSDSARRRTYTMDQLETQKGQINVSTLMGILRSHKTTDANWSPDRAVTGQDICMHAGYGPIRAYQSVGSLISHVKPEQATHWLTGTSGPCTSLFKPVWMDAGVPAMGASPRGICDQTSLFWRHELFHREILRDYPARSEVFRTERDLIENRFLKQAEGLADSSVDKRRSLSDSCFNVTDKAEEHWLGEIQSIKLKRPASIYYQLAWKKFNQQARILIE